MGPSPDRRRVVNALRKLGSKEDALDIKPLRGRALWLRLRVGDWRVLYRPVDRGFWVERVIHRRDLERAVESL
jgi:mRNA-degrading endonuclease RelE of RelBE toxin-antitoxin system